MINKDLNDKHNETRLSDKNDSIQQTNLVLSPYMNKTMNTDTLRVISIVTDTNLVALDKAVYKTDKTSRSTNNGEWEYYRKHIKEHKDEADDNVKLNMDISTINDGDKDYKEESDRYVADKKREQQQC